jgi:hypothetical protein
VYGVSNVGGDIALRFQDWNENPHWMNLSLPAGKSGTKRRENEDE